MRQRSPVDEAMPRHRSPAWFLWYTQKPSSFNLLPLFRQRSLVPFLVPRHCGASGLCWSQKPPASSPFFVPQGFPWMFVPLHMVDCRCGDLCSRARIHKWESKRSKTCFLDVATRHNFTGENRTIEPPNIKQHKFFGAKLSFSFLLADLTSHLSVVTTIITLNYDDSYAVEHARP